MVAAPYAAGARAAAGILGQAARYTFVNTAGSVIFSYATGAVGGYAGNLAGTYFYGENAGRYWGLAGGIIGGVVGYQTAPRVFNALDNIGVGTNGPGAAVEGVGKTLKPQNLMDELANSDIKYNADDVVMVTKTPDGKLMWLENGNGSAGLKHIVNGKATDFANKGITDIPNFLQQTLQNTPINTGMGTRGPFADYLINGSTYRVAYGTNGFIVSFYPIN